MSIRENIVSVIPVPLLALNMFVATGLSLTACGLFESAPVKSALDIIAPAAADALTKLVTERWGAGAEVDAETAGCFRADNERVAELVGDDDLEYVYAVCRAKAVE